MNPTTNETRLRVPATASHVARLREAGPGHWLTLDDGRLVIRAGQVRHPDEVEVCSFVDLATYAQHINEAGLAAGPAGDEALAAEVTSRAETQTAASQILESGGGIRAWSLFTYRIDPAMAARGLHRLRVAHVSQLCEAMPLPVWTQDYERGEDGAVTYVSVAFPSQSVQLLASIGTGWPEGDGWREITAALPDFPFRDAGDRVATAAARHMKGVHPGPGWTDEPGDWDPSAAHPVWNTLRTVMLATAATLRGHPRDVATPAASWGLPELDPHIAATDLPPPLRRWVARVAIARILDTAQVRNFGGRDPHDPVLLAQLRQTTPDPVLADIIDEAARRLPAGEPR